MRSAFLLLLLLCGSAAAAAREDDKRHDERHDERRDERNDERRDEEGDGGGGGRVVAGVTRAQWIARGFPAKEFDQHDADGSGAFSAAELAEWEAADALRDAAPSEGASDSLQHAARQVPRARALWLADGFPAEEFDAFDGDGDGTLSTAELQRWLEADQRKSGSKRAQLDEEFARRELRPEREQEALQRGALAVAWMRARAALGFFFDFARFAELLWLGAFCGYALKLAALRAGRRPADERAAELRMTSAQSVLMYCGVYATKWALPHTWRFHEAPGLDAPSAAAAAAVAALLGSLAGWEVEAFGAELLWSLWPGAAGGMTAWFA